MKTLIWPVAICVLLSGTLSGQFPPDVILELVGGNTGDEFGYSVAAVGDVNGDGIPDLIVGVPYFMYPSATFNPSARVYSGPTGSTIRIYELPGFGFAVAGAGDVNEDGYDEVAISFPYDSSHGVNAGLVQVFDGHSSEILFEFYREPRDVLGYSLAGVGDFDGDGGPDLLVGSRSAPTDIHGAGIVRVYSFPPSRTLRRGQRGGGRGRAL